MASPEPRTGPQGGSSARLVEVASLAGVSRQTVSNVLNAPHKVRPVTRQRVERAIARLGYQPNRAAQALQAQASRLIGYRIEAVPPDSLSSIHDRFLHALAAAGGEADYQLLLFSAEDAVDEQATCARLFRTGAVDGFVLSGIGRDDPRPTAFTGIGAPFVAFGRTGDDDHHLWVDVDNVAGTVATVDHLAARGHRRIAFVGWPEGSGVGDRRAEGWHAALTAHGLLADSRALDVRGHDAVEVGVRLGAALLDRLAPPTAVVAVSDTLAIGVLRAVRDRGLEVGRDVAVVGVDDTPTASVLGLSSVRQPIEIAGRLIIRTLLHRLADRAADPGSDPLPEPGHRLLIPTLVVRASSARPAPPPPHRS